MMPALAIESVCCS